MKFSKHKKSSPYALIQKDDVKAQHWKQAMEQLGHNLKIMPGSSFYVPLHIIRNIWCHGTPKAVVCRYLNDYPGFLKTFIRVCSELLTIFLCFILRIRLVWICHNVDRESTVHWKSLTACRRWLFIKFSHRILVTDKRLIPIANQILKYPKKTDFITFGQMEQSPDDISSKQLTHDIKQFIEKERQQYNGPTEKLKFGWTAGIFVRKVAHFERAISLINAAEKFGYTLRMIVVLANPERMEQIQPAALKALKSDKRVFFHEGFIEVEEKQIAQMTDFYWRVYRDQSTPLTVFHAAQMKKPILTQNIGFIADIVSHYNLGIITREDFVDLDKCLRGLEIWNPENTDMFLDDHNWNYGGIKLAEACFDKNK